MTEDCRLLRRAGAEPMPQTDVAPHAPEERERLADFLAVELMRPLHHSMTQHRLAVEQALNTMTIAERIAIEIDMTERVKIMHSYDYDALR